MKTNLQSLNEYLFEELERLNDDEYLNDIGNFEKEIRRSKAISNVAQSIVKNAQVVVDAVKLSQEYNLENNKNISNLLEDKNAKVGK